MNIPNFTVTVDTNKSISLLFFPSSACEDLEKIDCEQQLSNESQIVTTINNIV